MDELTSGLSADQITQLGRVNKGEAIRGALITLVFIAIAVALHSLWSIIPAVLAISMGWTSFKSFARYTRCWAALEDQRQPNQ